MNPCERETLGLAQRCAGRRCVCARAFTLILTSDSVLTEFGHWRWNCRKNCFWFYCFFLLYEFMRNRDPTRGLMNRILRRRAKKAKIGAPFPEICKKESYEDKLINRSPIYVSLLTTKSFSIKFHVSNIWWRSKCNGDGFGHVHRHCYLLSSSLFFDSCLLTISSFFHFIFTIIFPFATIVDDHIDVYRCMRARNPFLRLFNTALRKIHPARVFSHLRCATHIHTQ